MLFTAAACEAIGTVTVAFRRWKRPTVKSGGTLRTPTGVLAIDTVDEIAPTDIRQADVVRAGFGTINELLASLHGETNDRRLYRIGFHRLGDDPRIELRSAADLDVETRAEIAKRLAALDRASTTGPWTISVLKLIRDHPGTAARELAIGLGVERAVFKRRVRRLKELGLTESLDTGYRLSPRGTAVLDTAP